MTDPSEEIQAGELAAVDQATAFRVSREAMEELLAWQRARRHYPQISLTASVKMAEIMTGLSTFEMQMLVAALVQQLEGSLFERFGDEVPGEDDQP